MEMFLFIVRNITEWV